MQPLQPIQAKSVQSFGLVWLLTILGAIIIFPAVSVSWINYYKTENPAWIDLLYRQKQIALERRSSQPHRLIVVGGSGALFGIDAELIEKKLHIPTVNFATHAGLGLRYLLDRAQRELRPGDIVLLAPEYETWSDTYRDTEGPAFDYIWTYDKRYLARMNPIEAAKMIASIPWSQWPRSAAGWLDRFRGDYFHFRELAFYSVATLDPNGDINLITPSGNTQLAAFPFPADPNLPSVQSIRDFCSYAKSHGIQLLFTWPNIARPTTLSQPPIFLTDLLRNAGFTILDEPEDNTFPPSWFMDTPYHPNPACRRLRTEELIRRLRPVLGLPPAPPKPTGIFLLAGEDHRITDGNLFADDPGIIFRYLSTDSDPGAISPKTVAEFIDRGTPIYTDSDDAKPLLNSAGLTLKLQSRQTQTISQWLADFPTSIICIAAPKNLPIDSVWKSAVPADVYQQLISTGSAETNQRFIQPKSIPCIVSIQTEPLARITIDDREFVSSSAGVCVLAIDPGMGIVLGQAIFPASSKIETWRLYRVGRAL